MITQTNHFPRSHQDIITTNTICRVYAGSLAYGTNLPTSDVDIRGIFVGDQINLTPYFGFGESTDSNDDDTKIFEITKFLKLLADCNPNILEIVWCDDSDIILDSEEYQYLRSQRQSLLTSKVGITTSGYALSQLKRLQNSKKYVAYLPDLSRITGLLTELVNCDKMSLHQVSLVCGPKLAGWVSNQTELQGKFTAGIMSIGDIIAQFGNDQDRVNLSRYKIIAQPKQKDFVSLVRSFTSEKVLPRDFDINKYQRDHCLIPFGSDVYGLYQFPGRCTFYENGNLVDDYDGESIIGTVPIAVVKFNKPQYTDAVTSNQKFWQWRENRNPTRLAMEEQFDFDGKHAMHLIRLLRMGVEALKTGEVIVKRPDAKELLDIRNGKWTYDMLISHAEQLDSEVKSLIKTTKLNKQPDLIQLANIQLTIQQSVWSKK